MTYYVGIDIGSTNAKTVVLDSKKNLLYKESIPSGWSSIQTAEEIHRRLSERFQEKMRIIATGYGRISVPYADQTVTEISCHAQGAAYLSGEKSLRIIDIGGQDTKVIILKDGLVDSFLMNDKCAAGTGRFLEVMTASLGLRLEEMGALALEGSGLSISSLCTVFAQSEITSLIGSGENRENISFAVFDSIARKVSAQASKLHTDVDTVFLTGGLSSDPVLIRFLENHLKTPVTSHPDAIYAGALGAALLSLKKDKLT